MSISTFEQCLIQHNNLLNFNCHNYNANTLLYVLQARTTEITNIHHYFAKYKHLNIGTFKGLFESNTFVHALLITDH